MKILIAALAVTSMFADVDAPTFPRPGGGPVAIHSYQDPLGDFPRTWLLNTITGCYEELPFQTATVSPDGKTVAVIKDDGTVPELGVVGRAAWQRHGEAAVRWPGVPNAGTVQFSPDGKALLTYERRESFVIHRFDLSTGVTTSTVVPTDLYYTPFWAADSTRYLINVESPGPLAQMQYLNPDGTLGPPFSAEGGVVRGYSPSRKHVIIEPPLPMEPGEPADWHFAKVVDVHSGRIVNRIPSAQPVLGVPQTSPLLGWYDDRHVIRYAPTSPETTIEVVNIFTMRVLKRVPAAGLHPLSYSDVRSSAGLSPFAKLAAF
ncbi:TolB-like translocation protein [Catelliglobosispora koreensis]|uniref:hypothetical protein n=1 Tax=Catelliglobosispora koreensis TaxID=129052 RepID=UPI00037D59FD|nr:hypothetical protein [Catelliglobosispora koreensis]